MREQHPQRHGVASIVVRHAQPCLASKRKRRTKVTWNERLVFPWWMGGTLGSWAAVPVLWLVWRGSMRNLRARFDDEPATDA